MAVLKKIWHTSKFYLIEPILTSLKISHSTPDLLKLLKIFSTEQLRPLNLQPVSLKGFFAKIQKLPINRAVPSVGSAKERTLPKY